MRLQKLFKRYGFYGLLAGALLAPAPARAINIVLNYDNGQSVNPAQDPSATGLQDLFAYAETFYQDVFEDVAANTTLTINFWYEDLDPTSTGTIGLHTLVNESQSGGIWREVEANIRLDNDRTWFIDPTPENNSEFDVQQVLWRDLTSTQQNDFFNNFTATNIPDTFEVGFRGPADAGGAADGAWDMLSTVIHEVGHALGMSAASTGTQNETGVDVDYDFNSSFIFGQSLAVEADAGDEGHIDEDFALMCGGCGQLSFRRLPSHTDLFAMAAGNNYTDLDVPRREYYGGTFWNSDGNWSGNAVPGAADDVFVRDPGSVVTANLNANGVAANLTVAEGGNVDTEGFKLDVGGTVLVTDLNTDVFIRSGGELEAATLRIENQGEVRPEAGGLIDVNTLDINDTASLIGAGTVDVASNLSNDGTITATGGNLLTFTTAGGAVWNLDGGSGNSTVNAITGDISFASGTLSDAFDGDMNVGVGRFINFANGWELGAGGVLTLGGGTVAADRAEVSGPSTIRGDINVDKRGELDGVTTFFSTANVTINDADDRLDLGNATADTVTYHGGTFSGSGTLVQDGDAVVSAGSTVNIDVNNFDFDGDTISDTLIESGATMNITGVGITDAHNGVVTINSGTLNVNTGTIIDFGGGFPLFLPAPWEMAGSLVFLDSGTNPVLTGSKLNLTGAISVSLTGTGVIDAAVEFHPTSNTEVTGASDRLVLNGTTTFNSGTFTGFGEIEQNGAATVTGATTIATGEYDMDGSVGDTTINLNADLTLNVTNIDDGNNTFNGTINISDDAHELTVNTPAPWTMAGTLNITTDTTLTFPAVSGADFTMSGTTNVTGGSRFDARVDITGDVVFGDATSRLAILGGDLVTPNTIAGGTVDGPAGSSLRSTANNALVGFGDINVRLDFLAGSELLADNGTLNVQNNFISLGVIGTNDTDGVLNVSGAWNTGTATQLRLAGGSVMGGAITNGGQTFGFGTIAPTGDFINENNTTADGGELIINAGGLDLDGAGEAGSLTLNSDMTVNNIEIDVADNVFNGTIDVNSAFATLTINTTDPWEMAGVFTVTHGVNSTNTSIAGSPMVMSGTANINAWTGWAARTTITGTVNVNLAGDVFSMTGGDAVDTNLIDGGLITGAGRLSLGSSKRLVGNGTISTAQISMSLGSRILADDGTLTIDSTLNNAPFARIGTNDTDGNLRVVNPWNTNVYQALELNGGQVSGASITNGGLTTGFGTIATAGAFSNDGTLTADGGVLEMNPAGALDLDGAANAGVINAQSGDILVSKNIGLPAFAGTLNIAAGQSYAMNFGGLINNGQINFTGGLYNAPLLDHQGTLNVSVSPSTIDAGTTFDNGSNTVIDADLSLQNDLQINTTAGINGTASLVMLPGTTLTAQDGVQIGVKLVNQGNVIFGSSPGTLAVNDFTQDPTGGIEFELGGLVQGASYDWMKVGDNASLDGLLDVQLFGGFIPTLGDIFEIITAGSGVSGAFNSVSFPAIPNIGLRLNYTPNTVELIAGLEGDLDGDGFVGISDLNIVLGSWNGNVTPGVWILGDPSGDGFIGIEDLNVVLGNWNAGTPPTIEALDLVPEPATLALLGLGGLAVLRRR